MSSKIGFLLIDKDNISFTESFLVFTLDTFFLEIVHPLFLGGSFPYIAHFPTSQLFICTFQGNSLNACPIRTLLNVVERVVICEITVQESFPHST